MSKVQSRQPHIGVLPLSWRKTKNKQRNTNHYSPTSHLKDDDDDDDDDNPTMSTATLVSKKAEILSMLEAVGKTLPDRKRVKGTERTVINLVPTGEIKIDGIKDTFVNNGQEIDTKKNNLADKKIVLIFGRYSHALTRNFLVPKMTMIYHYLTLARDDVEFLYVSLPDESQADFDKFASMQRKYYLLCSCSLLSLWICDYTRSPCS